MMKDKRTKAAFVISNFVEFPKGEPVVSEDCEFSPRIAAMIWAFEWHDSE